MKTPENQPATERPVGAAIDDPVFTVDGLNVYYGRVHILQDVTFAVGAEPVAMVGRNGMGKTTLAKTIVGLLSAASGSVRFKDHSLLRRQPYQIVNAGIGYVPQGRRIFPSLTTHEHLAMVGASSGQRWNVDTIYDLFPRLADRRNLGAANLSGGEQQMLAIGRALLTNPEMLVMDEPSEGLAPSIVELLVDTFRTISEEGHEIFLIEQNLWFATALCDRVLVLLNGRVEADLKAKDLLEDEEAQQRYLGVA